MAKIIGYVLMLLGLALIVVKFVFASIFEKIPFLSSLNILYILVIAAILIVVGFLFSKTKKQAGEEVPIYHGKKIIGYRRK